jgi:hypothetical protein
VSLGCFKIRILRSDRGYSEGSNEIFNVAGSIRAKELKVTIDNRTGPSPPVEDPELSGPWSKTFRDGTTWSGNFPLVFSRFQCFALVSVEDPLTNQLSWFQESAP